MSAREDAAALGRLAAPVRSTLRRGSMLTAVASLLWVPQAALVAQVLAGLISGGGSADMMRACAAFLVIGILRALLGYGAEGILFRAGDRVVTDLRHRIVAREALHGAHGAGAMAALAGEKLDLILPWLTRYAPAQARTMVVPLVILGLAFWMSWAVGLVLLVAGPLIPVFMALVGLAAKEASQRQMAEIGTLNDLLVERLSALIDIRLLDSGGTVVGSFADASENLRARTMAVLRIAFLSSTVLELFSAIGVAMVAVYVGFALLGAVDFGTWGAALTPFQGIFLLLLAPDFFQPLRDLSAAWHDRAAAQAVAAEIDAWEQVEAPGILGAGAVAAALPGPAHIRTKGVSVHLAGERVLSYPDLDIAPGSRVAIMGPSGVGKTTLLRLMAGLAAPDVGQITVAGVPLDDAHADGWRARLGWMPQTPHFLNASLRHNITLGKETGRLSMALEAAAVQQVAAALPQGLNTRLGETGGGLSGGEARRVTLARAFHAAPDVLLADEPTADLDEDTAREVIGGLMALAGAGTTLIVATHDPALAARMDVVVQLGAA